MISNPVYMVGIGGIGMSALAQYLAHTGHKILGSDREDSPIVDMLRKKGIEVVVGEGIISSETECLIYSDAVPASNAERLRAREMQIPELSYFEALGEISKGKRTIAVSGTHGKTTTTGMLAKILQYCEKEPTAIIGSIVKDFGSNVLLPTHKSDLWVIEACEYRDHLLKLSPEILVITNIELDHTDYFPTLEALQETFRRAAERVPKNGVIVTNPSDPVIAAVLGNARAPIVDYTTQTVPTLKLIGEFNRNNARAAKAAAKAAFPDIIEVAIDDALAHFQGSWRRFEYKGETPSGALVYDDYAHHPTAVAKTVEAARQKFPKKKIIVAFHPHLYSRTRDFMDAFAKALATADEVILAPIYAAREEPIPGVSSEVLAEKISALGTPAQAFPSLHEVYLHLTTNHALLTTNCLLITMGAGDIYKVAEQIVSE